jgi:hypothetical protein
MAALRTTQYGIAVLSDKIAPMTPQPSRNSSTVEPERTLRNRTSFGRPQDPGSRFTALPMLYRFPPYDAVFRARTRSLRKKANGHGRREFPYVRVIALLAIFAILMALATSQ